MSEYLELKAYQLEDINKVHKLFDLSSKCTIGIHIKYNTNMLDCFHVKRPYILELDDEIKGTFKLTISVNDQFHCLITLWDNIKIYSDYVSDDIDWSILKTIARENLKIRLHELASKIKLSEAK